MTLQQLLDYIDARIKQNGNREITAPIDNDVRKKVIEWVNDSIGNLDQLDTSVKTSIVAAINSSLGDFIIKDKGIELSAGKTVVNISGGSANSITITGHYAVDFGAVTNKPEGFDGWAFLDVSQYVNGASTIIKQVAIDEGKFAWRTIENGTANDWQFVGQGSGYTGANNKLPVYDSGLEGLKDSVVEQINAQTLKIGNTTVNFATLMTEVAKIASKSNIGHTHEWSTILNKPYDIWTGRQYDASPEAQINYNAWLTDKFEASEEYSDALFIFYTVDHRDFDDWVTANGYDGSDFEVQKTAYLNVPANVTNFQRWQNGELPGMTNPGIALFAESTAYTDAYELFIIGYTYEDYANSDEWIDDFAEWKLTAGLDVDAWLEAIVNEDIDLSDYLTASDLTPINNSISANSNDIEDLDDRVTINEDEISSLENQMVYTVQEVEDLKPTSEIVEVPSESFNHQIGKLSDFRVIRFIDTIGVGTVAINNITPISTIEEGARLTVIAVNLAISLDSSMGNIVVGGGSLTLNMGDNITLVYLDGVWNEIARTIN